MDKLLSLTLLFSTSIFANPNPCDILILKKGNQSIKKYFSGSEIAFYTTGGMPVSGTIDCIRNDSIFLTQVQVRRYQTPDGALRSDTSARYKLQFSIANIGSFPAGRQPGKNLVTDGTLLTIGGAGFLVVNLVNTTLQGDPPFGEENLPKVLAATGAVFAGFLLKKAWKTRWVIGKKYQLEVLRS